VSRLEALPADKFDVQQFGALSYDPERYPLYRVKSKPWNDANPTVLITGGVHGYELTGVTGALRFLEEEMAKYSDKVNFVVYPTISPFAYEIDHRWNPHGVDPNREAYAGGKSEEMQLFMKDVSKLQMHFRAAVDLHETNQRDIGITAERRARDGQTFQKGDDLIPIGYYLVLPSFDKEEVELGHEVIEAVRKVTPIAVEPEILGYPSDKGIIVLHDLDKLMQNFAKKYSDVAMTTEIYPDNVPRKEAEDAQIATIKTAVKFAMRPKP